MKQTYLTMLLFVLMSMVGTKTFAYHIEVENADGVTIYYNLINDGTELEVTDGGYAGSYAGNVVIPESVAYGGNTYSVTSIGDYAFDFCSGLTELTIPNSVTSIGDYAFYGCSGLTKLTIPNSVTSIGNSAFYGCSGLTDVTFSDGSTPLSVSLFAFSDCPIETVHWGRAIDNSIFSGRESLTTLVIGSEVTSIGDYAFYQCSSLTELTIPNSVTSIGNQAFQNCTGLTELTIGNSVTSIGDEAFYNCSSLTELTIPNSVASIGNEAFIWCSGLTNLTVSDGSTLLSVPASAFSFCPIETIYWGRNIDNNVFSHNTSLKTLVIGDEVTSIGEWAFYICSSLTKVTIPNSVTSIGELAFGYCSSLTDLTIGNSVASIGKEAFVWCSGLTKVTIPNSVTSIGNDAFLYCISLTDLTIGNSVTSIGNNAFYGCSGLTELTIPNSVTSVGYYAFYGCRSLTELTIGNSVTSIGDYAFSGCSGLTELTIPNSVTSIGEGAFQDCENLTTIVSLIEEPFDIGNYVFSPSYSNATLYVPKNTKSKYTAAEGWQEFSKIIEDIEAEKAAAEDAFQEWQKIYGEYVPDYAEDGDVTTLYHQAEAGQEANSSKAQELLSSIEALEKKISESAMSEEDKQSYLATLQEMKDKISALEKESSNDKLLSNPAHDEAMKSIGNYDAKYADYLKRIDEATTCEELTELAQEMASDAEAFKSLCENDAKYLEEVIDRLSEILDELKKYEDQLKEYDTEVDDMIAKIFSEYQAEADAAYKEAQSIYERYLYYYNGEGMESYEQIVDAQKENEDKASGILSEIDELIKKVTESAKSEEEKDSYLNTLEDLKASVLDLQTENNDILSDNTFYADVQEHYAEVVAYHDGFASYEQRIEEATTSAELLAIIEQMKAATEEVEKSCLNPVVSEYEKLAAISDELDKISEKLDACATQLESVSGEVNDILTGIVNSVYGADDEIMVYTLSGMGQKMKKSDLRSLPKGIYIINGRKYVVK